MNKKICDLCKTNEADNNFKVKKDGRLGWERTDICDVCYRKLINSKYRVPPAPRE